MIGLIQNIAQIYMVIIIIAAIVSWIEVDRQLPAVQFLEKTTEPLFSKIRSILPPISGFDLSPVVALVAVKIGVELLSKILKFG